MLPRYYEHEGTNIVDFGAHRSLHDVRYRLLCHPRLKLAGCASTGREADPLDRNDWFQYMLSSHTGLNLAQGSFQCPVRWRWQHVNAEGS